MYLINALGTKTQTQVIKLKTKSGWFVFALNTQTYSFSDQPNENKRGRVPLEPAYVMGNGWWVHTSVARVLMGSLLM